jgi:hypothetical protein
MAPIDRHMTARKSRTQETASRALQMKEAAYRDGLQDGSPVCLGVQ